MNKLTFPEFQNPHTFLTSMTPSGSIPSGPPCSLQTKRLQLERPFPKPPNCTSGGSPLQPVRSGYPPAQAAHFLLQEQRKLVEQSSPFTVRRPKG